MNDEDKTFKVIRTVKTEYPEISVAEIVQSLKKSSLYDGYELELKVKSQKESKSNNRIIVTPHAHQELLRHFYWGQKHPLNLYEQQAGLVGHLFKQPQGRGFISIIEYIIPIVPAKRSPVMIDSTPDEIVAVYLERNVINKNFEKTPYNFLKTSEPCSILGYVHSHPNNLDVFMSGEDAHSHRGIYNSDDFMGISMVVNPHRREMVAFSGPEVEKTQIDIYCIKGYKRREKELVEPITSIKSGSNTNETQSQKEEDITEKRRMHEDVALKEYNEEFCEDYSEEMNFFQWILRKIKSVF